MEDSSAILCQISSLKDMLDQVNEEIEANFQITREIESEIVKCCEIETALATRESKLTKMVYLSQFEIHGLMSVTSDSRVSVKRLEEELHCLTLKRDEILKGMNTNREGFTKLCLAFQKDIEKGEDGELGALLSEKEYLENEIDLLSKNNNALQNSVSAFIEEILEDLQNFNSALQVEIHCRELENEKLLEDINELKTTMASVISM
ncbi:hypothetical protein LguiA_009338 [Lonicera macranthoides]